MRNELYQNPSFRMKRHQKPVPEARPFLKWAGGKTQLLDEFARRFPRDLKNGKITRYVEPFVGGGAVFLYLNQRFSFDACVICDINDELILTYRVIKRSVKSLIRELEILESAYLSKNEKQREMFFYEIRGSFNRKKPAINFQRYQKEWIGRAAQIIFLNHTCYNGLFRVNLKGEFNVPFGRYANPDILNEDNLMNVAKLLKNTQILLGDFTACGKFVDTKTFVYLDPPYRPLTQTASFTSYSKEGFFDHDQVRLAQFYKDLDKTGTRLMLSNSDPGNRDSADMFFENLFAGYRIGHVPARRIINCNGGRRGAISELVITNYRPAKA